MSFGVLEKPQTQAALTADAIADALEGGAPADVSRVKDVTAPGGPLTSGEWLPVPSIFRLRLTGTGTVTLDSRTLTGAITTGFDTYTAAGATDQIEFPFAGIGAVEIRGTFPATMTIEVI